MCIVGNPLADELGAMARANGDLSNGRPIVIDDTRLANQCQALGFPLEVARAVVVAHESGHKFKLQHYGSAMRFTNTVPISDPPPALTFNQYALSEPFAPPQTSPWLPETPDVLSPAAAATIARYTTYQAPGGLASGDRILELLDVYGNGRVPPLKVLDMGPADSIIAHNWVLPITPRSGIRVWRQWTYIMDWKPRFDQRPGSIPDLRSPDAWRFKPYDPNLFTPGDAELMCVHCHD